MKLSIVVPCYNEAEVIEKTNNTLCALSELWISNKLINQREIIYVDDGSKDDTLEIIKKLAKVNSDIKIISFSGNFGHQSALTAGLDYASGDAIVSLDADLQDPPEVIERMILEFKHGYDVVYGVRNKRDEDTFFKRVTAYSFYRLMQLMGVNLIYNHADFRLLSRQVVGEFRKYKEVNRFLRGLIVSMGFRQCIVEYERKKRFAGRTKYPFKKMLLFAIEGITSFSILPLRVATMIGLLILIGSFMLSIWAFITNLSGKAIPGWTSTVLPIYFLGSVQLFLLGVIGEYIGKIYLEVKKRPLYIVKEKYNIEE